MSLKKPWRLTATSTNQRAIDTRTARTRRILDFDLHCIANQAHRVRGDVFRRRVPSDAASLDIEVRCVPGTFDFLADDLPFGEGAAFVRTVVINRADLAMEVYEREALPLHLNTDRTVFGNLLLLRDFDESRHVPVAVECRLRFWEYGVVGYLSYLEAEATGLRAFGIMGRFFDDEMHELVGIGRPCINSTVGGPVDDARLSTLPALISNVRAREIAAWR